MAEKDRAPKPARKPKRANVEQPVDQLATAPGQGDETLPDQAAAVTPREVEVVSKLRRLRKLALQFINKDLKWALVFAALGFAISWLANVIIIAVAYDGFGKVPPGGPVTSPTTPITGSIFWAVGMAVLMGLLGYRRQVGGKRFWADLRGFPSSIVKLVRADGEGALGHILWGFAGAMLAAVLVSGPVSAMVGVGVLLLLSAVLRPLLTGLVMIAWRKVIGNLFPNRAAPPPELALSVVIIGSVIALLVGLGLPQPWLKLLLAVSAGVLAFVVTTRTATPAATVLVLGVGAAVAAGLATVLPVLASDGGWRECGTDFAAWLRCGGPGVMQNSLLAGLMGGTGGVLGGGGGTILGQDKPPPRSGWQAWLDGQWDGGLDQLASLASGTSSTRSSPSRGSTTGSVHGSHQKRARRRPGSSPATRWSSRTSGDWASGCRTSRARSTAPSPRRTGTGTARCSPSTSRRRPAATTTTRQGSRRWRW